MTNSIAKIRAYLGLTQEEFGQRIGVTGASVSNYEAGIRSPRILTGRLIVDLAKSYKFEIELEDIYPRFD